MVDVGIKNETPIVGSSYLFGVNSGAVHKLRTPLWGGIYYNLFSALYCLVFRINCISLVIFIWIKIYWGLFCILIKISEIIISIRKIIIGATSGARISSLPQLAARFAAPCRAAPCRVARTRIILGSINIYIRSAQSTASPRTDINSFQNNQLFSKDLCIRGNRVIKRLNSQGIKIDQAVTPLSLFIRFHVYPKIFCAITWNRLWMLYTLSSCLDSFLHERICALKRPKKGWSKSQCFCSKI